MAEPTRAITPYLTVKGAADAIAFYQKAFGATELTRMLTEDRQRLMHAEITINGASVMLSDEFPEYAEDGGAVLAPTPDKPAGVAIAVHYGKPADVDASFKRAVAAGCRSITDPQDMFFGSRFAMLRDPFGHRWILEAPLPKL